MTKNLKIRNMGNACGVTLPKEVLARLGADLGELLFMVDTVNGVKLTRYDPDFESAIKASRDLMQRYPSAMKKLAE